MKRDEFIAALGTRLAELGLDAKPEKAQAAVEAAVLDYSRYRPRTCTDTLALVDGTPEYPKPDGFISLKSTNYGRPPVPVAPWDRVLTYRPEVPRVIPMDTTLRLEPAPSADLLSACGSSFTYYYSAAHVVDDKGSTINPADDDLIIMRAEAELMKMIAEERANKPSYKDGFNQASNSTYGGLYSALIKDFEARIGGPGPSPVAGRG